MTARIAVYWYFHSYSTGFNCFEGGSINTQALKKSILGCIGLTLIDIRHISTTHISKPQKLSLECKFQSLVSDRETIPCSIATSEPQLMDPIIVKNRWWFGEEGPPSKRSWSHPHHIHLSDTQILETTRSHITIQFEAFNNCFSGYKSWPTVVSEKTQYFCVF